MKIAELTLLAGDLPAQREFYAGTLGLPVMGEDTQSLAVQAGSSRLVFKQAPSGWHGFYHFAFNVPGDRFREAKDWAARRVPLIKSKSGDDEFDFENWRARALYFYDPEGNILEFIARRDLSLNTDQPFSERSILSVSEIGVVTEDVPGLVRSLRSSLAIEVFRGSESETFTALGDDHGLLIVVKQGRIWFPDTGKAADLYPLEAVVAPRPEELYRLVGPPYGVSAA